MEVAGVVGEAVEEEDWWVVVVRRTFGRKRVSRRIVQLSLNFRSKGRRSPGGYGRATWDEGGEWGAGIREKAQVPLGVKDLYPFSLLSPSLDVCVYSSKARRE